MQHSSFFIAVEGIDGSGTTTFISELKTHLESMVLNVHTTYEPSSFPSGQLIRNLLSKKTVDNYVLALLFAADRIIHYQNEILPNLNQNKIVISDRYKLSSLAYQGVTEDFNLIKQLNSKVPEPDLLIFLSIDEKIAENRINSRGKQREALEYTGFQQKVAANYKILITQYELPKLILDAKKSPKQLVTDAIKYLKTKEII